MAADTLAPRIARPSAAMILKIQDKSVLVFHKELFQLPRLSLQDLNEKYVGPDQNFENLKQ